MNKQISILDRWKTDVFADDLIKINSIQQNGGEGSGNFGHAGRPGQVGGSQAIEGELSGLVKGSKKAIKALSMAAADVLYKGKDTGHEYIETIGEDGERIEKTSNAKDHVNIDLDEMNRGFVSVHNHPSSSSFSKDDMEIFIASDNQYMVVIGHNGDLFIAEKTSKTVEPFLASNGTDIMAGKLRLKIYEAQQNAIFKTTPMYHKFMKEGKSESDASRLAFYDGAKIWMDSLNINYSHLVYNGATYERK